MTPIGGTIICGISVIIVLVSMFGGKFIEWLKDS